MADGVHRDNGRQPEGVAVRRQPLRRRYRRHAKRARKVAIVLSGRRSVVDQQHLPAHPGHRQRSIGSGGETYDHRAILGRPSFGRISGGP